jgi:hypothetical protein
MLGLANATITIPVNPSTPTSFDPYTGEPAFTGTTYKTVRATLEETTPPKDLSLPGVDNPLAYLEGRILDNLPDELKPNLYYNITISLQTGVKSARFYVVSTPVSRLGLDVLFGKAIAGWLTN